MNYLPLYDGSETKYIIRVPGKICFLTVSVPLLAFTSCVLITMYKDFEDANNTHCQVPNIFPSISASISNYEPQTTIWATAIYLHSPVRLVIVYFRWKYYRKVILEYCDIVVHLAVLLNIVENFALLGLTHWSSTENYPYHEKCFKTFIATSILYMFLICILLTKYRRRPVITDSEKKSVKLKWRAFIINATSFAFAAYFFLRHNSMCEPYVYSMFGFSEYIVVISNIAFHSTTLYDLHIKYLYITKHGLIAD